MISVIIPAFDEETNLPSVISRFRNSNASFELIVVDGGSGDQTVRVARDLGAFVLKSPAKQRAAQMNLGAAAARGDILLFLHADTLLPSNALQLVRSTMKDPETVGGAFSRLFASPSRFLDATCKIGMMRARRLGWFFGDQAIFCRAAAFRSISGFRNLDLFEDLDFSRRLRTCGQTVLLSKPVISSARRFQKKGAILTAFSDFCLTLRYLCSDGFCRPAPNCLREQGSGKTAPPVYSRKYPASPG